MAISRMQNPRQLQGIGSLRQPYGLGKLVKKAFRGIKKIAKSPLGKAAIIGGLGMIPFGGVSTWGRLGGMLKGMGTASKGGGIWNALRGGAGKLGGFMNPWSGGSFSGKKLFGLGAGAAIAAPFLQKALKWGPYGEEEEEETDWTQTPGSILNLRNQARDYYRAAKPDYIGSPFMPDKSFVPQDFYAADGGRAGLLNGGEAGEAQMEQMLRAEYLKYKNQGGTMPYEQFKILVMKQAQQGQTPNQMMADGGRIGFFDGGSFKDFLESNIGHLDESIQDDIWDAYGSGDQGRLIKLLQIHIGFEDRADGGRAGYAFGEMVEQQTDLIEGPQGTNEFQETVVEGQDQPSREQLEALAMEIFQLPLDDLDEQQLLVVYQEAMQGQPMEEAIQEEDVQFAAQGGRMGFWPGGPAGGASAGGNYGGNVNPEQEYAGRTFAETHGGGGGGGGGDGANNVITQEPIVEAPSTLEKFKNYIGLGGTDEENDSELVDNIRNVPNLKKNISTKNEILANMMKNESTLRRDGGRIGAQEGGLMDLGGMEKDYREEGGFVPLGGEERADDVPARLSKNEFVFTADAVRAAGGGDIDTGSEVMQNMMDNLEQGGEISEESQGQNPAQGMYNNYEQLQSRVA